MEYESERLPANRPAGRRFLKSEFDWLRTNGDGLSSTPRCRAGTCPRRCRSYRLRTSLFMPTVCRFADGGDMSPPYRERYDNDMRGRYFLHRCAGVVSAAVRDEGALRMRHTPCGCAPYGESAADGRRDCPRMKGAAITREKRQAGKKQVQFRKRCGMIHLR